jgi:hypothetical protein
MNLELVTHLGSIIICILCPPIIVLYIDQLAPPFIKEKISENAAKLEDDEDEESTIESGSTVLGMDSMTFFWIICIGYILLYIPGVIISFMYYFVKIPHIRRFYQLPEDEQMMEMSKV